MMTKQTKFILAIVFQLIVIFTLVAFKLSVVSEGTEVALRIIPVDPSDPFRGDYITFQYDISNLPSYLFDASEIKEGQTVYVILDQGSEVAYVRSVQRTKPVNNDLFIKGKINYAYKDKMEDNVNIIYGAEEYFVPEGTGRDVRFWEHELVATVIVDGEGKAVLKQVFIDGKPWP